MCGNYFSERVQLYLPQGSPPRVRELLMALQPSGDACGITPACAGITFFMVSSFFLPGDHPRVCGNYFPSVSSVHTSAGSPPRVRELPERRLDGLDGLGITPACAGITQLLWDFGAVGQDHPRVCGNYLKCIRSTWNSAGSPPRVRELPLVYPKSRPNTGITPACAGITHPPKCGGGESQDHPRVCGNYTKRSL